MLELLFVGAHHDDIEIGAGGTLAKFIDQGHKIFALILTDGNVQESKDLRREESILSLAKLGLNKSNILFCNFEDGNLMDNKESISILRSKIRNYKLNPDIVFCHTAHDSHNDHRRCNGIVLSSFRESIILCYAVVNSLLSSSFHPQFFVDTTNFYGKKIDALNNHESQIKENRIQWDKIEKMDGSYGKHIGAEYAESFEIFIQIGGESKERTLLQLNDAPLQRLWWHLIQNEDLYYIHSLPRIGTKPDIDNWVPNKDRSGAAQLRETLVRVYNYKGFIEIPSSHHKVEQVIESENVLFGGGPVNNIATRNYFNHFPNIRYVIDYDMPGYHNIRVFDRKKQIQISPNLKSTREGKKILIEDIGILTIMKNIMCKDDTKIIICCMGIHGFGASGCYNLLTDNQHIKKLLDLFHFPFEDGIVGYQTLLKSVQQTEEVIIIEDSVQPIIKMRE